MTAWVERRFIHGSHKQKMARCMTAHTIDIRTDSDMSVPESDGFVRAAETDADAEIDADVNAVGGSIPFWSKASFEHWSLSTKLRVVVFGAAIIPFLVTCVLLGQYAYFGKAGSDHADRVRAEILVAHASLAMSQAAADLTHSIDGPEIDTVQLAAAEKEITGARADLEQALMVGIGLYPDDIMTEIEQALGHAEDNARALQLLNSSSSEADIFGLEQQASLCAMKLRAIFDEAQSYAKAQIEAILQGIMVGFAVCVGLTLAAILASFLGARVMIANIVGQITDITQSMKEVAAGDVEVPIPGRHRNDEIGAMARSLAVFRSGTLKLRKLTDARAQDAETQLAQQQILAEQLRNLRRDKRQLLEGLADGFEVSVGDLITAVSAASSQLKATSRQMGDLADGSNGQAQRATDAMESATANVTAAAAATDEFSHSISEISQQAAASAQLARSASELVTTANTKMTDLSNAALEIGEIVGLIQTIAQRTNLLALNASIEAARGGEAGRGFAVVASEVKELAMQTSNATRSVAEKITAMQAFTRSSAGDLGGIVVHIEELENASVTIAAAVDEQSVSGEELARNIETVASGSAQVAARLGTLREASEETGSAADDVVSSVKALGDHADDLRHKAGRFISDVRRSARDLEASEAVLQTQAG